MGWKYELIFYTWSDNCPLNHKNYVMKQTQVYSEKKECKKRQIIFW